MQNNIFIGKHNYGFPISTVSREPSVIFIDLHLGCLQQPNPLLTDSGFMSDNPDKHVQTTRWSQHFLPRNAF